MQNTQGLKIVDEKPNSRVVLLMKKGQEVQGKLNFKHWQENQTLSIALPGPGLIINAFPIMSVLPAVS